MPHYAEGVPAREGILPMFPLGSVLFPHVGLPLRVFEPRYRQLVLDCLDGANSFGVVLIERGSEVGGGDARFGVGTVARIVDAAPSDDGTWSVTAVGGDRIRVLRWAEDAPYPRAEVETVVEPPVMSDEAAEVDKVIARLRRSLTKCVRANVPSVSPLVKLSDDPMVAAWQACAIAPLGPMDQLALLRSGSLMDRIAMLSSFLDDHDLLLAPRLGDA
jgi:uncharacterized protein